ncbi:glycoside hydrolase/deacetylase [Dendrothele bispora CBS 962.96]|uniref:Glycoside hydrolase/deacetylase n=1 Tax=Dendrothele bispora (strain CBS 962.96) TaxID=1314807 RepID=A0A4S8MY95_DENBC|nr:glycoside hydrolase/deacetylase [Dendrothele bispora CBS 962.96]
MISLQSLLLAFALTAAAHPRVSPFHHKARATTAATADPITECNQGFSMTYDDGPYIHTTNVSSNLQSLGAKGTFYMNGDNYGCIYDAENVAILQQVYSAGHQIASHTWSHPDIATLTDAQLDVEILRLDQAFIKILGIKPNILRPPYGSIKPAQVAYIEQKYGKKVVTWELDSGDSQGKDSNQEILAFYQGLADSAKASGTTPPHFTLAHDVLPQTGTTALEAAEILLGAEFSLITTAECLGVVPYTIIGAPQQRDATWTCTGTWTVDQYSESVPSSSTTTSGSTTTTTGSTTTTTTTTGSTTTTTGTCTPKTYTVVAGDTCWAIAQTKGVTVEQLQAANSGVNCDTLMVNDVLNIPCTGSTTPATTVATSTTTSTGSQTTTTGTCTPQTYTSVSGDTCASIGQKYGLTADQIFAANNFLNCNDIWAWTPVQIPCPVSTSTSTTAPTTTAATTTTTSTSTGCTAKTYSVVAGDFCYAIAEKNSITVDQLVAANKGLDCSKLMPGDILTVPCSGTSASGLTSMITSTSTTSSSTSTTTSTTAQTCASTYTSKAGDTCASIASRFGLSADQILNANTFLNCADIWTYTPICIPPGGSQCTETYTSVSGDTCSTIATKFGTTSAKIQSWNSFLTCSDIWVGTPVCVKH